jgi:hypothetical protein
MFWVRVAQYKFLILVSLLVACGALYALAFMGIVAGKRRRRLAALRAIRRGHYQEAVRLLKEAFLLPITYSGTPGSSRRRLRTDLEVLGHLEEIYLECRVPFDANSLRALLERKRTADDEYHAAMREAGRVNRNPENQPECRVLDDGRKSVGALLLQAIERLPGLPRCPETAGDSTSTTGGPLQS